MQVLLVVPQCWQPSGNDFETHSAILQHQPHGGTPSSSTDDGRGDAQLSHLPCAIFTRLGVVIVSQRLGFIAGGFVSH